MNPNFRAPEFLLAHIRHTMAFYHPRAIDPRGGMFHYFRDDGSIYDSDSRHLVSSTRFVFTYAMAYRRFGNDAYRDACMHAVRFLREAHRQPNGGYAWTLQLDETGKATVTDSTNHCYGLAFVVLAYAHALMAGITECRAWLDETIALMEARFWSEAAGLYADEADADWVVSDYRGQNANMHSCEAMLAAYDATGEVRHLHRAERLAHNITVRQAALAGDMMWEHYKADWSVDWDYNRHDKSNIFRPWGYQPGHLTEWAKLLLTLERHRAQLANDPAWLLPRARHLFDTALQRAWDDTHGGIYYGFAPDGSICDDDKYFWVQAESLAAAACLAIRTGESGYWTWYDRIWDYAWRHFVDHRYGAWFRILTGDNKPYSDEKSPAGKVDYHTMGACYEVLGQLGHHA
ncbi:AGE family epimerase/isomerase [Niveibacterium umoris]|uniref:Mannose/cellobiose epimerase-like protein (N-acyl-D-glucosamine 2-epimerase family) n=1 Tax=Niveibacterium umoris TaxID=1193620 RepID=A0A840BB09_9RHOO|nr:AGE family epimerase/isomerase [Niveibacterium umoris]MBB4010711.1 mannose/cellobiose epimerase-like protein (N-acyl-D-glucosamine 2-epimerase family) [Niveibacterium umoris]